MQQRDQHRYERHAKPNWLIHNNGQGGLSLPAAWALQVGHI